LHHPWCRSSSRGQLNYKEMIKMQVGRMEWRRFELINENDEDKLLKLIKAKNLSRENLMLILKTIKLRELD
jgi:hypothetical protein